MSIVFGFQIGCPDGMGYLAEIGRFEDRAAPLRGYVVPWETLQICSAPGGKPDIMTCMSSYPRRA